jgi:hypothetical protein
MLELPQVSLIALTNQKFAEHKKAIDISCEGINFGAVKLIWDEKCTSIDIWNEKIIKELPHYVQTPFAMLIHADGYIINPTLWRDDFLEYDFIGAPFPLPVDNYSYLTPTGKLVRVGNSVSLRSKRLMDLVATRPMEYHYGNNNEDGQICTWQREWLEEQGCKFAPLEVAVHFSKEHEIPENVGLSTFAFHSL